MTGDDQPLSWMAVFQTTFSFSLHLTGRPVASECPAPLGPRNWFQLSAATAATAVRSAATGTSQQLRMTYLGVTGQWKRASGGWEPPPHAGTPPGMLHRRLAPALRRRRASGRAAVAVESDGRRAGAAEGVPRTGATLHRSVAGKLSNRFGPARHRRVGHRRDRPFAR